MHPRLIVQKAEDLYVYDQKTLDEISSILGVSENTLSRWKQRLKWKEKCDAYLSFIPKYKETTIASPLLKKYLMTTAEEPRDQMAIQHLSESKRQAYFRKLDIIKNAPRRDPRALEEYLKEKGISSGTLRRWRRLYKKEGPEALIDKRRGRTQKLDPQDHAILAKLYLRAERPSITEVYRQYLTVRGQTKVTIHQARKFLENLPEATKRKYRHGERAYREFAEIFTEREYPPEEIKSGPILLNQYRSIGLHAFLPTGIQEMDRVLGGGFHIPSSVILAGDPGVGKSTLMLQVVSNVANAKGVRSCVYISAEQDISQIKKRIDEIGIYDKFYIDDTSDSLEHIVQIIREMRPKLVVVDSIKRIRTSSYKGTYDSPYYVSYCGKQLTRLSKETRSSIVLINHMTKKGDMSGLKSFEHDVDVVLYLQGNPLSNIKMLYASKNRYGDTAEVGFFKMTGKGLIEVNDIEYLFRQKRNRKVFGVSLVVVQKGQRILPLEIQSLVGEPISKPRTIAPGLDKEQITKVLRIMKERLSTDLTDKEITVTTSGEIELNYPYIQLAIFSAIMSNIKRIDVSKKVFIGEVDLTGSVRPFYGQKKLLNSILGIGDIDKIYAPRPADPVEYLEDARITYTDDIYSLSESVFGLA